MYNFRLTEEISRWAFEIKCQQKKDWYIAFTNPTAGPWKKIKAKCNNEEGEIHKFELEETRPDIVILNDNLKSILVIEAKDSLYKLIDSKQVCKSVEVVNNLTNILSKIVNNKYWGQRNTYNIYTALLWGSNEITPESDKDILFNAYYSEMKKYNKINTDFIIGIETLKTSNNLLCNIYGKLFNNAAKDILNNILQSLS